jgi:hypothetical protein
VIALTPVPPQQRIASGVSTCGSRFLPLKSHIEQDSKMLAQFSRMINDGHRAGLAYRRVIDRSVGLTDQLVRKPSQRPVSNAAC